MNELPPVLFGFPGALRDTLVAAVLSGAKTTTTALMEEYDAGEPLPEPGRLFAVIDSAGDRVGVIETVEVRVIPISEVDLEFAVAEGEGYTTVAGWRAAHERFWRGAAMSEALGYEPEIGDDTLVVAERFRLVESRSSGLPG